MSREQTAASVNAGIELAGLFSGNADEAAAGEKAGSTGSWDILPTDGSAYRLLAAGEMGIGNTTTAAAILSVLLDRTAQEVTGRGQGSPTKP